MKKIIFSFLLCMLFFTAARAQSVNGIVLADTANYKVIQVFGGHYPADLRMVICVLTI